MENIDKPPGLQIDRPRKVIGGDAYSARPPMVSVVVITSVVGIRGVISEYFVQSKYGEVIAVIQFINAIALPSFGALLIDRMANGVGADGVVRQLNAWGFMWRMWISFMLSMILAKLLSLPFLGSSYELTFRSLLIIDAASYLSLPICVWAFFSINRRAQLDWFYRLIARLTRF